MGGYRLARFTLAPKKVTRAAHYQVGFTLIELVIVIVLLATLAVGSVQFISFSAQGYVDTVQRSELAATASIVNEKLSRAVRSALPSSVRVSSDGKCMEFIPVLAASRYTQAPVPGAPVSQTEVHMVPLDSSLVQSGHLSIYPVVASADALYNIATNPGYVSTETASLSGTLNGAQVFEFSGGASFRFVQSSAQNRIYVTDRPRAFCQSGSRLFLYGNYGFIANMASLPAALPTAVPDRVLIADQLQIDSVRFQLLPASLRRNGLVSYTMTFQKDASPEVLNVSQEIQVRNVP